jgi:HD-like signal output (HDOD) protein
MKNWLNRLKTRPDAPDASTQPAAPSPSLDPAGAGIDAAWYGWLTASAATEVPDDLMQRILDQVRTLARDPAGSAQLVPRVPEVVPQLLRSLGDEDASSSELARQVAQDVVLVAEVIREANSAYYRPITPVKNAEAAIVMLGQNGLRMLLARVAFRPIVNMPAEGFAKRAAPRIWDQSVKCALAASLMAPGLTAGVFESYLAGLMQNVGLMVALRLADRTHPGSVPADPDFGAALLAASREISAGIAAHWEFPPEVAAAIARAGDPGDAVLAQALAQGDRIAKLRMLVDAHLIGEDDPMVADGLTSFQRRCLGKLENVET